MLGLSGVYALSLGGFCCAAVLVYSIKANPPVAISIDQSFRENLLQGIQYIRTRRILRGVFLLTIVANFFGFSYVTMVPVIGRELLVLDPVGIGFLQAMEGAGAVLAAIFLAVTTRKIRYARSFTIGGLTFLTLLVPFAVSPWFSVSALALFVAGAGNNTRVAGTGNFTAFSEA